MKAMGCVFLLCWAAAAVQAGILKQQTNYQVDTVTQVISGLEFECRLKDFPYAKSARFRVTIQNIRLDQAADSGQRARQLLQDTLTDADTIRLKNVHVRNYFRLSADVYAGNTDLAGALIAAKLAEAVIPPPDIQITARPKPRIQRRQTKQPPANGFPKPAALPTSTRPQTSARCVSLEQLLNSEVDLSMINDSTPLDEALEIMKNSVRPSLPLLVLWNDLETNAMIERDQPIGVSGFGRMKLAVAMKVIMNSASSSSGTQLVLVPEGRVLTLGTRRGLNYKPTARVYSIEDLTLLPSFANDLNRSSQSSGGNHSSGRNTPNTSSADSRSGR